MAVNFKSFLIAFYCIFISTTCVSDTTTNIGNEVVSLSLKKYRLAEKEYENKLKLCEKNVKVIPLQLIDKLGLSSEQEKIDALSTLSYRALESCLNGTEERFFRAAAIYREVAKKYKLTIDNASWYTEDFMYSHYWSRLEREVRYMKIDQNIRSKIEQINDLKAPFDLIKTIEGIRSE